MQAEIALAHFSNRRALEMQNWLKNWTKKLIDFQCLCINQKSSYCSFITLKLLWFKLFSHFFALIGNSSIPNLIHFIQSVYNIFGSKLMIKTETIVNVEYVDAPAVTELNFFWLVSMSEILIKWYNINVWLEIFICSQV